MSVFKTTSIYIKRAEMNHTENYIINKLYSNNYGIVDEIKFIKKTNNFGKVYHGAIVTFKKWFENEKVKDLFMKMIESEDGTAKIIHDIYYNKFWIVNIHKQEILNLDEENNNDFTEYEKKYQLELLVCSLKAELKSIKINEEKNERRMMEYENIKSHEYLVNNELKMQLHEKDLEREYMEKLHKIEINNLKEIIANMAIDKEKLEKSLHIKHKQYNELKQHSDDDQCILKYTEREINELKNMLNKNYKINHLELA